MGMEQPEARHFEPFFDLPFAPEKSPYKIKGNAYRRAIERFQRDLGGLEKVLELANNATLTGFYAQPFMASSWYDVFPLPLIHQAGALLMNQPYDEYIEERSRETFEKDVRGIYRMVLKVMSPQTVVSRLARIQSQYFSFAETTCKEAGKNAAQLKSVGFPAMIARFYVPVLRAYTSGAVQSSGGQDVRVQATTGTESPGPHGVPLTDVTLDVSWS